MQIKQLIISLILLFGVSLINTVAAQVIKNNNQGDRIIVYKDGSWRYFNENDPRDQALWENQMNQKNQTSPIKSSKKKASKLAPAPAPKGNSSFKKSKGSFSKTPTTNKPTFEGMTRREAIRYAEQIAAEEARAIKIEEDISLDLFFLREDLEELKNSGKTYNKVKEQELLAKIKDTKLKEKNALRTRKALTRRAGDAAKLIEMEEDERAKAYAKLESIDAAPASNVKKPKKKATNKNARIADNTKQQKTGKKAKTKKVRSNKKDSRIANQNKKSTKTKKSKKTRKKDPIADIYASSKPKKQKKNKIKKSRKDTRVAKNDRTGKTKKEKKGKNRNKSLESVTGVQKYTPSSQTEYIPPVDILRNPPTAPCKIAFEGIDEFTGKKRRDTERSLLFTYTSDELKPYLKEKDFVRCEANLMRMEGGRRFIFLFFKIASTNAQREFGMLEKGSQMIIYFLDGSSMTTQNIKTDPGQILNKSVDYTAQYMISADQLKAMTKKEVDQVRIVWSLGFEDYDIYDVDFFKNQAQCLIAEEF